MKRREDLSSFAVGIAVILLFVSFPQKSNSQINRQPPSARKFAEFRDMSLDEMSPLIDRFVDELNKDRSARAYLIGYDARVSRYGDVKGKGLAGQASFLLLHRRDGGLSLNRVVTVEGGLRAELTAELFIVPRGARPPLPTPSFRSDQAIHCPVINIFGPLYVWETQSPLQFEATIRSNTPRVIPSFIWTVSAGRIMSGQGSPRITVEHPGPFYQTITASVSVGGFSSECNNKSSIASPANLLLVPYKFDDFGKLNCEDELARLDNFAVVLHSHQRLRGYIIIYGGRRGLRNEAHARAARMKAYLTMSRGVTVDRIITIDGGFKEELAGELWLSIPDGKAPIPSPTVNIGDVKLSGTARVIASPCM